MSILFHVLIVKKDDERFLAHGSVSKTYLLQNCDKFLNRDNGTRYQHEFKVFDLLEVKKQNYYILIEKKKDGTIEVPIILNDFSLIRKFVKAKKAQFQTKQELKDYKYNIVMLTQCNYDNDKEDISWIEACDFQGRVECTYERRSSGELDMYRCVTLPGQEAHLGYVDNMTELREFFDDEYIKDRYFCIA